MEILEAILKYFTDNSATLINIMLPILITFFITWFFRNKDKKDNNARNIRAELREYFLTNCKPVINEILEDQNQTYRKHIYLIDKHNELLNKDNDFMPKLLQSLLPLIAFTKNLSNKEYEKRFHNYYYMTYHILTLYGELIKPHIMNFQVIHASKKVSSDQKDSLLIKIIALTTHVDCILAESELILFNYNFDNDDAIFQKYIDGLNKAILDTGLDNAKDFLCNREELEQFIDFNTNL